MNWRTLQWVGLALLVGTILMACQPKSEHTVGPMGEARGKAVRPGTPLQFPQDHGAHNDYGIEWWYITANLFDEQGRQHGVQWTLFRFAGEPVNDEATNAAVDAVANAAASDWWQGQWYMGHLGWSPPPGLGKHRAWERWGRGGNNEPQTAQAGVRAAPFSAWLDNWLLQSRDTEFLPLNLVAQQDEFAMALVLDDSPLVRHGEDGYSQKSADGSLASFYYSYPLLKVSGHLKSDDGWFPVTGTAWLDREWSSKFLDPRFAGWDWLSAQLDSGEALMTFCMRPEQGADPSLRNCAGSIVTPDGALHPLDHHQIDWRATAWSELDDGRYPVAWQVGIDAPQVLANPWQLEVETLSSDQRNQLAFPYWEGPVRILDGESGSQRGVGFIEMTGYSRH
ncbi:lipocalin-like domain-containing protein [Ferrimonas pelagia]|uniref:Lipocalin-like domain-containing protein n=1 Tax=Ferrimonas pelagia TaxID=1177826 RepID=A0ABP9EC16_9GAMM